MEEKRRMDMITFDELREQTTPDIIKKMVELAEGFEFVDCENGYFSIAINGQEYGNIITDEILFPLLLHRAVEGWNKEYFGQKFIGISYDEIFLQEYKSGFIIKNWIIEDYLPCHLTACEMVIMDCLSEVLG